MWNKKYTIVLSLFCLMGISQALSAAEFYVNPHRFDPYKQYRFKVKWDGKYIPGILSVNGLHKDFMVGEKPNAAGFRKFPLKEVYVPLTIKKGRTHDTSMEQWMKLVSDYTKNPADSPNFRKDIIVELYNEAGQLVMAFRVMGCWPSHYSAVENFDANNTGTAIESIILEHEGWERDTSVTEPQEY